MATTQLNSKVGAVKAPDMYHYLFDSNTGQQRDVDIQHIGYLQQLTRDITKHDIIRYNSEYNRLVYESSSDRS